jgi:hypothetical protein
MFTALRHLAAARMSMSKRFSCCIISCARSDSVVVPVLSILHRSRLPYRMLSRFALSFRSRHVHTVAVLMVRSRYRSKTVRRSLTFAERL